MKYNRPLFVLCVSLVYFLLYSTSVVINRFQIFKEYYPALKDEQITYLILHILESYQIAFAVIFLLTINRLIFLIFTPLLFVISAIAAYFISKFKVVISTRSISVLFEGTQNEIASVISLNLILWTLLAIFIGIKIAVLFYKKDHKDEQKNRNLMFSFFAGVYVVSTFSTYTTDFNHQPSQMPYNYIKSTVQYFSQKKNKLPKTDISDVPAFYKEEEPLTVVFIIGESARGDHFGINGYERDTTPNLRKVQNLINFGEVNSCDNLTGISVPCMLTRSTSNKKVHETTLVSVYKKLGFKTIWLDVQNISASFHETDIQDILKEVELVEVFGNNAPEIDSVSLPAIDKVLDSYKGNLFLIIHSSGNHWNYDHKYENSFKKWYPTCSDGNTDSDNSLPKRACKHIPFLNGCEKVNDMSSCGIERLTNSYDNSILHTDYFISEIINKLNDRRSIVLYSSDHGESLGEDGYFFHGQYRKEGIIRPEQYNVPMLMWFSDSLIEDNPEKYRNIRTEVGKEHGHDIIFHSLLDCSGIKSDLIDSSLSVCNN